MVDYKHIENLIERFFEGETSNKEENELYSFFSQNDIPEHLKSFIPVFQFFETKIEEEFKTTQNSVLMPQKAKSSIKPWSIWIGIAASILVMVTIFSKITRNDHSFDPYEESYIIRNGKVITDMKIIRPELEATLANVYEEQENINKLLKNATQKTDYEAVNQQIEDQYCALINSFPDEITRNEVKKILNVECK